MNVEKMKVWCLKLRRNIHIYGVFDFERGRMVDIESC